MTPGLLVFDGPWLKQAFVKNFNVFINRRRMQAGGPIDESLFSLEGEHWKFVRKMLSPEFSSGKLKRVSCNMMLSTPKLKCFVSP